MCLWTVAHVITLVTIYILHFSHLTLLSKGTLLIYIYTLLGMFLERTCKLHKLKPSSLNVLTVLNTAWLEPSFKLADASTES